MIVSVEAVLLFLIQVMNKEKSTEKTTSDKRGDTEPSSTPMAIPVKAPCPRESEKKAMRFDTTIVLSRPKSGVTSMMARKAFFMKSLPRNATGSRSSRE